MNIFCWAIETNSCASFSQTILYGPGYCEWQSVESPADKKEKSFIFSISDTFGLMIFCPILF